MRVYPVIMCGGSGTRLWPLSRAASPKQYQRLFTDQSMLEETLNRISLGQSICDLQNTIIISGKHHKGQISAICDEAGIDLEAMILEPLARNTAPVAAIAATYVARRDPDALILLLPADHHVENPEEFWKRVEAGLASASQGYLTTLGIAPSHPETGYGYIQKGTEIDKTVYQVDRFVEKPDYETAKKYFASGDYFWNAGIFLFNASAMVSEFEKHAPDILTVSTQALERARHHEKEILLCKDTFSLCKSDSIDYAVMEKTEKAAIIAPVRVGWNDIGSWSAVADVTRSDETEVQTHGDVIQIDCENSYIRSEGPLVAAIGVDNLVIVATKEAILISRTDKTQEVKQIVEALKADKRDDLL